MKLFKELRVRCTGCEVVRDPSSLSWVFAGVRMFFSNAEQLLNASGAGWRSEPGDCKPTRNRRLQSK